MSVCYQIHTSRTYITKQILENDEKFTLLELKFRILGRGVHCQSVIQSNYKYVDRYNGNLVRFEIQSVFVFGNK